MKSLTMTVIIPTYKPDERFRRLLRLLEKQTRVPEKILIVNTEESLFGMAEDELPALCQVKHIRRDQFDHGGTRDSAIRSCDSDIVVCMTMDAVPADVHLLENLVRPFEEDTSIAAAYARQLPAKDCDALEKRNRAFNYGPVSEIHTKADLETKGVKTFFCSNACAAWRRSTYLEMGGFEKRTIFNEDMIFAGKLILAGYSIAYAADARVIHSHNYTGLQQLHRNFDLGVSQHSTRKFSGLPVRRARESDW